MLTSNQSHQMNSSKKVFIGSAAMLFLKLYVPPVAAPLFH